MEPPQEQYRHNYLHPIMQMVQEHPNPRHKRPGRVQTVSKEMSCMNYTLHVPITMLNIHITSVNLPFLILQLLYGLNCKHSEVLKSKAARVTCFFLY